MGKVYPPELKKYMDKQVSVRIKANRVVSGTVRGFDAFMNLVIDQSTGESGQDSMVIIRGNAINAIEALE